MSRLRSWVPRWWRGEGGPAGWVLDRILAPAELAYRGASRARNSAYDRGWIGQAKPSIPVVSIGNIAVGGAGKTPFSAWTAARLGEWGWRPAIVLRGYGTDEILVHRELNPQIPVFAHPRRLRAVEAAAAAGCDVAVLDDAFQHRALARRMDIVLVAAESWRSPFRLLPRGPWREGRQALRRADVVVVTRKTAPGGAVEAVAGEVAEAAPHAVVATCRIQPTHLEHVHGGEGTLPLHWLGGRPVLAVASLADPRPFQEHLRHQGAEVELLAYADHHEFTEGDAVDILASARGRALVMTRKEAVKLRRLLPAEYPAMLLGQRVVVERGGAELEHALRAALD